MGWTQGVAQRFVLLGQSARRRLLVVMFTTMSFPNMISAGLGVTKYASRYAKGRIVVTLDPDVAAVFPGAREANEALRALARVIRNHRARRSSKRTA
jgi:hypothetical protein